MQKELESLWQQCVAFHGHGCGGLAVGFRAVLYRGFDSPWFYLIQIILILRSIWTFAIKNLSKPSYHGFCLR